MQYTTIANIERRLRGRLTTGSATAFGTGQIDPDLLTQVLDQVENYIDARLATRYTLPVTADRLTTLLGEITELLVICRVMPIHFSNLGESQDGGYGAQCCEDGNRLLDEILAGTLDVGEEIEAGGAANNCAVALKRTSGKSAGINWGNPRL